MCHWLIDDVCALEFGMQKSLSGGKQGYGWPEHLLRGSVAAAGLGIRAGFFRRFLSRVYHAILV